MLRRPETMLRRLDTPRLLQCILLIDHAAIFL